MHSNGHFQASYLTQPISPGKSSFYTLSIMHDIVEMDIVDVELIVKKAAEVIPSLKQEK